MKQITLVLLLGLSTLCTFAQFTFSPGLGTYHELDVNVNGLTRDYQLYVPPGHDGLKEWPLVLLYHGFATPIDSQILISSMYEVADTAKFMIAYPQGWVVQDIINGGSGEGWKVPGSYLSNFDDVAFTSAIIDDVIANPNFAVDPYRIHATGWSNGGEFASYLACALPDKIASVALVAAALTHTMVDSFCSPIRPISVLHMQGTEDIFFPAEGDSNYVDIHGTASYWAGINGCDDQADSTFLPDIELADSSTITLFSYQNCDDSYEVISYHVLGGGHTWPGGYLPPPWSFLGNMNQDINGSEEIYHFFKRNPHPDAPASPPGLGTYHSLEIQVDTLDREYLLYAPPGDDGTEALPLVFLFHGFNTLIDTQILISELYKVADTANFYIVYPQGLMVEDTVFGGIGPGWHVPGLYDANHSPQEDIDFVSAIIDQLDANPCFAIDSDRIHATGWSNGGEMAFFLACGLSERIASVAGIAASMSNVLLDTLGPLCIPFCKISVLHMQGTEDLFFPAEPDTFLSGISGTGEFWSMVNGCDTLPDSMFLSDMIMSDSSTVIKVNYDDCAMPYEVISYQVQGGGHSWPGGYLPDDWSWLGNINRDIHASVEIWKFFQGHINSICEPIEPITSINKPGTSLKSNIQIYPNPFSYTLTAEVELFRPAEVQLTLFTLTGQAIGTSSQSFLPAGTHPISLDFSHQPLTPGMYYLQIKNGKATRMMSVLHHDK